MTMELAGLMYYMLWCTTPPKGVRDIPRKLMLHAMSMLTPYMLTKTPPLRTPTPGVHLEPTPEGASLLHLPKY